MSNFWVSWEVNSESDPGTLPPDLMPYNETYETCDAEWGDWYCTRIRGHTGRHAAGTGAVIVAVWHSGMEEQ